MVTSGRSGASRRLRRVFKKIIFGGKEKGQRDSLCPCEVYFEIGGDVVADEGLGAVSKVVLAHGKEDAHRDVLGC